MPIPRLYVLAPSHYCERARWGLDRAGVPYEERALAPLLHVVQARRLAPASTLPILVADGTAVQGSGAILAWAGLGDGDPAIEDRFETRIGPLVRRYIYAGTLHDPRSNVREILLSGVPPLEAALVRAGWPIVRRAMAAGMRVRPDDRPALEARLVGELDWADTLVEGGLLADGRTAGFGRAEITAASLLAPLARPDALPLYRTVRLPPEIGDALDRWSARPILRWVARAYAGRHRRAEGA